MNNAVLVVVYDRTEEQYDLTRQTVASAMAQDIPVDVYILNNGSTCEATLNWLSNIEGCTVFNHAENESPCKQLNRYMTKLFEAGYDYFLGLPNDVICPPNLYRKLLEWPQGIVTPGMHGTNPPEIMEEVHRIHGDCHMSAVLFRKSAYEALMAQDGCFYDEGFFMYASDCDLKMRLGTAKVSTAQLDILCWHFGGASHRLGIGADAVYRQADVDREYFTKRWGFAIGSEEHGKFMEAL